MNSADVKEITPCDSEDKSLSKDNCKELEVGAADSLAKSVRLEPCSSFDHINNTENIEDAGTLRANKNNENFAKQADPKGFTENSETSPKCDVNNEFSDVQEEEIKLSWDDDENSEVIEEIAPIPTIIEALCENIGEAFDKNKTIDIVETDNNDKELIKTQDISEASSSITLQSDSFVGSPEFTKREHGINKPDVMLEIPGMLPDMDDELDNMNVEIFSDNERDLNPEDTEESLSELVSKVNANILSSLNESELDSKLEMSSDDDTLVSPCPANKTNLEVAIENEMVLLSETISSIDEQDDIAVKPADLADITIEPAIEDSNLMTAIQQEVKSLAETMSNIEQDDPMDDVPNTISEISLVTAGIGEETKVLELQATPTEKRENNMKIKVSTIISSIEKEMQLLDSNDEMEISVPCSGSSKFKEQDVAEAIKELNTSKLVGFKDKKISSEVKEDIDVTEEISLLTEKEPKNKESETEPKTKELDESELRQKELDELALAVKAIEPENQIYESAPAVTLLNVNPVDELSEISVIDEDDQPSISIGLDDDIESIEVLHQNAGPISAIIDESEVSVIQDSDDDELPILRSDADDILTESNAQNAFKPTEIHETNNEIKEKSVETERVETEITTVTSLSIAMKETDNGKMPAPDDNKMDDVISSEVEKDVDLIDSTMSIKDAKNLENANIELPQVSQGAAETEKVEPEITTVCSLSVAIKGAANGNLPAPDDNKMDNDMSSEVEKDVDLIDSSMSIKDAIVKENLENVNIELPQVSQGVNNKTNDDTIFTPEQDKDILATEHNDKLLVKVTGDFLPQPSTSTDDFDMKDSSNDVPDSDTLGLLAESTRVMDDDDDQDDDDDDDDDFYQDDESNLMTAEHSEDSNPQSDDANEAQDVETEEKETTKQTEIESTDVSMAGDQDDNEQELLTPEQRGEEFQFTISNVTNDEQKENETSEAMETDVELEAKTVDPNESNMDVGNDPETTDLKKSNSEPVKKPDTSETVEKPAEPDKSPSVPAEKDSKSPSKMLNLSISSQQSVWNFVDLEESSEDEIQIVPKPSEPPATTKQAEPQPALDQSTAEKQPEKQTPPKQPDATPTPVSEEAEGADVDMNVEILDTEILNLDDAKDAKEDTTEKTSTDEPDAKSEPSSQQISEEVGGLEVFTLDSDDEDTATSTTAAEAPASRPGPEPVKRDFKCVNSGCQYAAGAARRAADAATLAYYNADRRRRALVCEDCLRPVLARSQDLMEGIRNLTPLLELEMTTLGLDLVEISDSDSEGEADPEDQEKEKIGDVTAKFLEENLADMINETWVKYQMDSRLSETESVLQMELRRLEVESKDIQSLMRECQATTDRIRTELYASFPQEIMQAPPLIIYDTPDQQYCYVQATLPPKDAETPAPVPTRMSKRRLEAAAAADSPAKRPAIPLGYTPLDTVEQTENKTPGTGAAVDEKIDDDNTEVSVVNIISSEAAPPGLPPPGELVRPPYKIGMTVFGVRSSFGTWGKGKVLEIMPKGTHSLSYTACKVKFEQRSSKPVKIVLARSMAFPEPANARLTIGTRVIANFKDTKDNKALSQDSKREAFFPGIVAEVPNPVNKYRYLIFFDDGYAQYVNHEDCRLICECASLVWEEVHPYSRDFVREYLLAYPERPMVRLHPSQSLKTEWNGKWWTSRVVTVDASLAQVYTPANERYEWIYRGSTRLAPLYLELQAAERHRARPMPRAQAHARTNMPVVEYTRYDEQTNKTFEVEKTPIQRQLAESIRQRAVAKKSTGGVSAQPAPPGAPPRLPPGQNLDNVTSRVVYYTPKNAVRPHKLVPHTCGPKCKRTDVLSLKDLRTYNPLAKPLLSGWERQIVRYKGQKVVAYRAPCGRRVRTAPELHRYLRATRAELPVDLFDFSPATHCLAEFVLNKCLIMKKDLSQGKENVPVPCVNYYDDSLPEFCLYNTERTPTAGVPLNLDPEFLCGCDCEDDCEDKSKCACWKLTLEGARTIGLRGDNVGYEYKRLPEPLPSGIYECNSRCKCKHTCLNRVAQHPLQLKLQIFKTLNRGWGIRALNDVPKGSFLCVYAGNLLTDATANLDGLNEGDEYLAELDYIEVVEQMKEGYEDDIPKDLKKITLDGKEESDEDSEQEESSEEESEQTSKTELEDDDFQPAPHYGIRVTKFSKRLRERKRNKDRKTTDDKKEGDKEKDQGKEEPRKEGERGSEEDCITISDDDDVREPSSFAAAAGMGANAFVSKYRSVRSLFGEDESCYIMDAKVQGNIGRYLNHSCSPNVFVQNVFVDTHDPRFPWVAFFALSHVRAGTELTWNYNYDVGSVPGKALYCYCGAPNCRGRLL